MRNPLDFDDSCWSHGDEPPAHRTPDSQPASLHAPAIALAAGIVAFMVLVLWGWEILSYAFHGHP